MKKGEARKPGAEQAKSDAVEKKVEPIAPTRIAAYRAANRLAELRKSLDDWYKHYDGYDPLFTWWNKAPYKALNDSLDGYVKFLREKIVGVEAGKDDPIIGDPVGRDGLMAELDHEMIAYTPEQLIDIANREFAWCDAEWKKAAREMGFGDDWKAALEKVKRDYVQAGPGELVVELALEAIKFVTDRKLVTIPPLAADMWRLRMLSPEAQKVSPFFLGGNDILVSYPTDTMEEDEKMQSLRANNIHFARATVFHELLPGHHLQFYYLARDNQHRELFDAVLGRGLGWRWEFQMWDLKFPQTRGTRSACCSGAHRCARIIFCSISTSATGRPSNVSTSWWTAWATSARGAAGGAPVVQRRLVAALPGRLHDGPRCSSASCTRADHLGQDDGPAVSRQHHAGRQRTR